MLAKINRFHGHSGVRRVYKTSQSFRGSLIGMHVNPNNRIKSSRVAVVVSKKVHKSAVKRNRIRRRVYEVIRLSLPEFKSNVEIVATIYREEVASINSTELRDSINDLLKKANIL